MEQELFSTANIAAELEHKSKNPNRDVLNIAKRLGFTPVATRPREGKNSGGKPEMFWSREQRDAILADNRNRHKEPAQIVPPVDEPHDVSGTSPADETPEQPDVTAKHADCVSKSQTIEVKCVKSNPPPVVEEITIAQRANRIRELQADVQRGIIEIGNELIAAKEQVGHGNWSHWLETEFSWTQRTANNFMRVAERFGKMENVFQFQPSTLQAMLLLPEDTEQEFIDAQAAAGTPVETQSAREVQRNVKAFKKRHAVKKDSDNTEPVDADVDAEEPTLDLSNRGETFSIFGREVVAEPMPSIDTLPAQMNEPDEDTNVVATPAQVTAILKLIDETDDEQQLNSLKIALTDAIILIDAKRAVLAQKN